MVWKACACSCESWSVLQAVLVCRIDVQSSLSSCCYPDFSGREGKKAWRGGFQVTRAGTINETLFWGPKLRMDIWARALHKPYIKLILWIGLFSWWFYFCANCAKCIFAKLRHQRKFVTCSGQYGKGWPQYTKSGQLTEATYHDQSGVFLDCRGSVILINLS